MLFTKVDAPPPTEPQSAIWHFGWHVTDARRNLETYKQRPEVELLPLYTTDEGGSVLISSDTWPNIGNVLGLTKAQIAEAKAKGLGPAGRRRLRLYEGSRQRACRICREPPGRALQPCAPLSGGPDRRAALVSKASERAGAAGLRADTQPRGTSARGPDRTWPALNREGMFRTPRAGVEFGDVSMMWYANQGDRPLASSRGQLQDHIGLSVADLDAWIDKLRGEGVKFLEEPYPLGDTRAVMIEGPSREALELVEVK